MVYLFDVYSSTVMLKRYMLVFEIPVEMVWFCLEQCYEGEPTP